MDLGKKLFELRKSKNLTQDEVAEKLNVTRQTISKWETNQSTPDFDKIIPLCELYEITADELLKGKKQEETIEENNDEFELNEDKKHLFNSKKNEYENMSKEQIKYKSAEIVSSSIFIFIIAVAYTGIGVTVLGWNPVLVGCSFLVLIGWGVARIIKHYMAIPRFEKTEEEKKESRVIKQINDIIRIICITLYFLISFTTMAWHITWIIFIINGLICQIVKLIFMLKEDKVDEE